MNKRIPMTLSGHKVLEDELRHLKKVERPQIVEAIATARDHGDLKENAEYHAAREKQSFLEGRIQDLEGRLSNCQVIDVTTMENTGKVIFGSTVTAVNVDTDEEVTYQIVGEEESDISENKIAYTAPIARALIGKSVGDEADVETPSGAICYEIERVDYI